MPFRRMHSLSAVAVAAAVITVGGCAARVDSAVFMSAPPLPSAHEVRIYSTQSPPCAYDELGIVTWRPAHGWEKLQTGVDRLRDRAREMGGHAIVGFRVGERSGGTTTTIAADSAQVTVGTSVDTQTVVSGTVVRFREADCR